MNENENIFEGLPNLGDQQGLQTYIDNQAMAQMGIEQPANEPQAQPNQGTQQGQPNAQGQQDNSIQAILQQLAQEQQNQQNQQNQNQGQPQQQQYTAEQIQKIIAENNALKSMYAQRNVQPRVQVQPQANPVNAQKQAFIANALAQGYTPEQIYSALNRQNAQPNPVETKLNQVINYLNQQQYAQAEAAFVDKMNAFGEKWGLSEQDLVLFANTALEKGMNVATVKDVEAVFRAIYPEQYQLRLQRMQNNQAGSPIYGGTSVPEAPRATQSKLEDAYVEQFLKSTMPNQYKNIKK